MKIVQYLSHLFFREAGPGNVILALSRALKRRGVDVLVVFDPEAVHMPLPDDIDRLAIEHRGRGVMIVPVDFESALEGSDVVVLHGGWTMANVRAGRAARGLGIPYVVCPHGNYYPEVMARRSWRKRAWLALFERRHLNSALAIHVFFPEETAHLEAIGVSAQTLVAPNGLDVPEGVTWDGGSGGYLLWYGRFDPECKGIDLLLRALALLPEGTRASLRMYGPDWRGGRQTMRDLAKELSLDPWVTVGDSIYGADKWTTLTQAKGFIYPSRWDACPVAVGEAVTAGVPTLVTDFPLARLLTSQGAAFGAAPEPKDLAKGIGRLLSDQAAEVGKRGPAVASRVLNWDAAAQSWVEQLEALLKARP